MVLIFFIFLQIEKKLFGVKETSSSQYNQFKLTFVALQVTIKLYTTIAFFSNWQFDNKEDINRVVISSLHTFGWCSG